MIPIPFTLIWSIGQIARNKPTDVASGQVLLNLAGKPDIPVLPVDGKLSPAVLAALKTFQLKYIGVSHVVLCIEPNSTTVKALIAAAIPGAQRLIQLPTGNASTISEIDYQNAALKLGCEVAAVKAVAAVESAGRGFLPSGRPKILFEALHFAQDTHHKYDQLFPDISSAKWDPSLYRGGEHEYHRLRKGMLLDRTAALRSTSWGKFQILGKNCRAAGHVTLDSFVVAMCQSERAHLDAFCAFVTSEGLVDALRKQDWKTFARGYNGPHYDKKHYDLRIEDEYNRAKSGTRVAGH